MLIFSIPIKNKKEFTSDVLKNIAKKLFNREEYIINNVNRRNGRYITLEDTETAEVHYIVFSNPKNNARNARLMQYIAPAYTDFYFDDKEIKKFDAYILLPCDKDKNSYSKFIYRCLKTLDMDIINEENLHLDGINVFVDYYDFKRFRTENQSRNSGNNSTFFSDDDNQISIFGKTFGANQEESFVFALVLNKLVKSKPIIFYPVVDNDSRNISRKQKQILENMGISYGEVINELSNTNIRLANIEPERDTPKFHYNLLKKYGEKKCLLCDCDMEHLIIGSHIERVADIKNSGNYSDEEKIAKIVDGENGFWLCANHDKMFEYGIIYFVDKILKCRGGLSDKDINFITYSLGKTKKSINKNCIDNKFFSRRMSQYLQKHRKRIGVE